MSMNFTELTQVISSALPEPDVIWRIEMATAALTPVSLPGPTGESNTLYHERKGHILMICTAKSYKRHYQDALISALLIRNRVSATFEIPELKDKGLPIDWISEQDSLSMIEAGNIDGLVYCGGEKGGRNFQAALSQRVGPIIMPIMLTDPKAPLDPHVLYDMATEKVITNNTAAIGGNPELLGLPA